MEFTRVERPAITRPSKGPRTINPWTEKRPDGTTLIQAIKDLGIGGKDAGQVTLSGGKPGIKPTIGKAEDGGHAELSLMRRQLTQAGTTVGVTVRMDVGIPDKKGSFVVKLYPVKPIVRKTKAEKAAEKLAASANAAKESK